jgi:hypothetical protein
VVYDPSRPFAPDSGRETVEKKCYGTFGSDDFYELREPADETIFDLIYSMIVSSDCMTVWLDSIILGNNINSSETYQIFA